MLTRGRTTFKKLAISNILETTSTVFNRAMTTPDRTRIHGHITVGDFNISKADALECLRNVQVRGGIFCEGDNKRDLCFSNLRMFRDTGKMIQAHDKQHGTVVAQVFKHEDPAEPVALPSAAVLPSSNAGMHRQQPPPAIVGPAEIIDVDGEPSSSSTGTLVTVPAAAPSSSSTGTPVPAAAPSSSSTRTPVTVPVAAPSSSSTGTPVTVPDASPSSSSMGTPVAVPAAAPSQPMSSGGDAGKRVTFLEAARQYLMVLRERVAARALEQNAAVNAFVPVDLDEDTEDDDDKSARAGQSGTTDGDTGAASSNTAAVETPLTVKTWGVSRDGTPCKALVRMENGLFYVSERQALDAFEKAFEVRGEQLRRLGLGDGDCLPFQAQLEAQKALEAMWWKSTLGVSILESLRRQITNTEKLKRTLPSYYRRSQYEDYGGREWCQSLIVFGKVDQDAVAIFGEVRQRQKEAGIAKREAGGRPRTNLPRSERPDSSSRGVNHKASDAKAARAKAATMAKRLWWGSTAGERQAVDRAWDFAEARSREAGHGFKDRNGNWVQPQQKTTMQEVIDEILRRRGRDTLAR